MKLNNSLDYLCLLSRCLNEDIAGEVSSAEGQYKLQLMNTVLEELKRREDGSPELLKKTVEEGRRLRASLQEAIGDDVTQRSRRHSDSLSFSSLLDAHKALTEELDILCRRISRSDMVVKDKLSMLREVAEWECAWYQRQAAVSVPEESVALPAGKPLDAMLMEEILNSEYSTEANKPLTVVKLSALTGGFGKQTFLCQFRDAQGETRERVVRKADPVPIMKFGSCLLDNEYALLKTLSKTDFPAPRPLDFVPAGCCDLDGPLYTVVRSEGEVPGGFLQGAKGELSKSLVLHLAELLGRLHSTPITLFKEYAQQYDEPKAIAGNVGDCYRYNLAGWDKYIANNEHLASPYLVWLTSWLKHNIPEDSRPPVLVHGDFNIHNVLAVDNKISIVLDWECAGFGASEQDLAYIKPHIEQHIDWQEFLAHYKKHGGREINEQAMAFGMAYAALRTNLAGNHATFNLQHGRNTDIRYAMVELGFTPSFMSLALNSTR